MNRRVTLRQALEKMPQPDAIMYRHGPYELQLSILYSDVHVEIFLSTGHETCMMQDIANSFRVDGVNYYLSEVFEEHQRRNIENVVDNEMFTAWMNAEDDLTCAEAWQQLRAAQEE